MGLTTFGVVSAGSLTDTWDPTSSTTISQGEPGTIQVCKRGNAGDYSIVKVVKMHATTRCSVGEVLFDSTVSTVGGVATVAIVVQDGHPPKGIACASITSGRAGYAVIGGIATSFMSQICTNGDYLAVSGSTAAQLSNNRGSGFGVATWPLLSMFMLCARVYQAASNISVGSSAQVKLIGLWG